MQRKAAGSETLWDVAVIGGGPAGMMAAGRAAEMGASVVLLEKNKMLGKKLLITGGGRCNVTNNEPDTKKLLAKFKDSGKFLSSPFSRWSVSESLDFFHTRGMPTKVEAEQRVFPLSNTAQSVWDTLVGYLRQNSVNVISNAVVIKLHSENEIIVAAELKNGEMIRANSFILATGGTSHPETGSTGDGYMWLRALGHTVIEASAALVPVALKSPAKNAAGVALPDAKITLFQNDVKQAQGRGKILFTHVGLSGPATLNMSREIGELLKYGDVMIEIDLLPLMGYEKVNAALQDTFKENANKMVRNSLKGIVPPALVPLVLDAAGIDGETFCNSVTRESRVRLMKALKHWRFEVKGLLGMDKAVITAGGVALTEIDWKSMRSLKYANLYLVGDILNIDRPSGGYSLQLCWTTGYVAGSAAVAGLS
jgi:predicted Rossmann fold flavoprotein